MSAIHTGSIAARLTTDGLWQYTGTSHDHAVTGWDKPAQDQRVRIPAQRAGSAYEQVVLNPDDDLADLSDLVQIPTLTAFTKTEEAVHP